MTESTAGTTTPWRRTASQLETGLTQWAHSFLNKEGVAVSDVRVPDSGMANDTVLFRLNGEALVARLAPAPGSPYPTFPRYDLELQRSAIELVRERTNVPVPEIVHLEDSDVWLGAPFMVTRQVEGLVPSDNPPYLLDPNGWFLQGTSQDWRRLETSTIEVLVQLHQIGGDDETTAFLQSDQPGGTALAKLVAFCHKYYDWARDGQAVPVLERAIEVLSATLPSNRRCVLNWGDARPGNIIYRDFVPVVVLDWEMAGLGPPEVDLAWTTFFQRFFGEMAQKYGLAPVPAMFQREESKALYERLSGETLDNLAWYEALAGLRFGIILMRMSLRSIAFGTQEPASDPDALMMFAPLLEHLLDEI